ncbi:MAG TPA: aminoglycoside phosphotransferase family protein [Candidatus Babeliales bacterium]|nr:aminoglycoside phosphotransferase family protein [Candidatus Babeliales bacterium]
MIEKPSPANQCIIDCLNNYYGIEAVNIIPLPLGADIDASVYKVQSPDHLSYFVKLKRGHNQDIGVTIQLRLHNAGIQEIISPIKTNHDQATRHIDNFTLTVYPFIEGQDGFVSNLTDQQWITLGKALRQIHEFEIPPLIKDQLKREVYSSKWRKSVRAIFEHIDNDPIADQIAVKLIIFMKEHREAIERLVDRAEQLAQKIQKQSPEFVLCHSDIHAGNVLIAKNGALYIVDWDAPIMAPKERDLMFIGGGVGYVWNNTREEELFYKGYGKTEINMAILTYYRHERIVEDIALYAQELLLTNHGGKERPVMYKQFVGMFEPNGVVDIAFTSDKNL